MKAEKKQVKKYMKENVTEHVEWLTLEVNYTTLAEDACEHFHDYEEDGSIDQTYYDLAIEIGIAKERELKE